MIETPSMSRGADTVLDVKSVTEVEELGVGAGAGLQVLPLVDRRFNCHGHKPQYTWTKRGHLRAETTSSRWVISPIPKKAFKSLMAEVFLPEKTLSK